MRIRTTFDLVRSDRNTQSFAPDFQIKNFSPHLEKYIGKNLKELNLSNQSIGSSNSELWTNVVFANFLIVKVQKSTVCIDRIYICVLNAK